MPREWDILEICKNEQCCYYPGSAAWSCESVQEDGPDTQAGGCDTESERHCEGNRFKGKTSSGSHD
jgi:hypothetical protein